MPSTPPPSPTTTSSPTFGNHPCSSGASVPEVAGFSSKMPVPLVQLYQRCEGMPPPLGFSRIGNTALPYSVFWRGHLCHGMAFCPTRAHRPAPQCLLAGVPVPSPLIYRRGLSWDGKAGGPLGPSPPVCAAVPEITRPTQAGSYSRPSAGNNSRRPGAQSPSLHPATVFFGIPGANRTSLNPESDFFVIPGANWTSLYPESGRISRKEGKTRLWTSLGAGHGLK